MLDGVKSRTLRFRPLSFDKDVFLGNDMGIADTKAKIKEIRKKPMDGPVFKNPPKEPTLVELNAAARRQNLNNSQK